MTQNNTHPSALSRCEQQRLAETPLGAVDTCDCGMMQLHVGALTLRLTPEAVSELSSLLANALLAHARLNTASTPLTTDVLRSVGTERGQA